MQHVSYGWPSILPLEASDETVNKRVCVELAKSINSQQESTPTIDALLIVGVFR